MSTPLQQVGSGETSEELAGNVFSGGGEMGRRMRSFDWSRTALGPVEGWPQSLKTSVSTCLNSRFAILVWWGKDLVKLYNDAYRNLLGNKHPQALGANGRDVWPEIWHVIGPMLEGVMTRGEATWSDNLMLEPERNGYPEECYFTFSYSPIRDESGGVGGVFTPVQETTAQVIGERRLRTLRDLTGATQAAGADDGEEVGRAAAEIMAANPYDLPFAAVYLYSDDRREVRLAGVAGTEPGTRLLPAVVPLEQGTSDWLFGPAVSSGQTITLTVSDSNATLPHGAWPVPPQEVVVLPVKYGEQHLGALILGINPRKRLDEEYHGFLSLIAGHIATALSIARSLGEERKRAAALAELDRAKTQFFSNVSHEFRTPLTLLLGPLEDVLSGPDLAPAVYESVDTAHRNALRLLKMVNSLLEFSRIEAGQGRAEYRPTDLAQLTAEFASLFRSASERAGLRLVVDCPPLSQPVYVDREMWEKVVLNLLSNAFKFTFEGELTVRLREHRDRVELEISDTGTGIPAQELPRLFERFHRVDSARGRTFEGSGIGLALVQELVKLHGGSISVESELDRGSTFRVTLPLGRAHLAGEHVVEGERDALPAATRADAYVEEAQRWLGNAPVANGAGPRTEDSGPVLGTILLADDNADMRDYVQRLLQGFYRVVPAANGEEALALALTSPPDLVLSDVMMPGLDGFGLLRGLREHPLTQSIPVILLSARAGEEARTAGMHVGADDYLVKPFSARELLARVSAHLKLAQLRKAAEVRMAELNRLLHERVSELETLLRVLPIGIGLSADPECRHWQANPALARFFAAAGNTTMDRMATSHLHAISDDGMAVPDEDLPMQTAAREGREIQEQELNVVTGDGSIARLLSYAAPLFDDQQQTRGAVGAFIDISERRRAESRDRFLLALDDAIRPLDDPSAITRAALRLLNEHLKTDRTAYFEVDEDQDLVTANDDYSPRLRSIAGQYRLSDFGENIVATLQANHPYLEYDTQRESLPGESRQRYAELEILSFVAIPLHKEGKLVSIVGAYSAQPRQWTDEEIDLVDRVAYRCWESIMRSRVTRTLRDSELRFRQLAESMPQIVWTARPDGSIDYYNERWYEFTGLDHGSLPQTWGLFLHPQDAERCSPAWADSGQTGQLFQIECRFWDRHEKRWQWFMGRALPARDERGEIVKWFGTWTDIDAQKRTEEELRRANEDLNQFAFAAAHDLQEPLRQVTSYVQLLLKTYRDSFDPDAELFIRFITDGTLRMSLLLKDLLEYSEANSGRGKPMTMVPFDKALQSAIRNLGAAISETGADVTSDELPVLPAHDIHIVQLFQNLVANAIKYRRADVSPRIHISARRATGEWEFTVQDNGMGIKPEYQRQIFGLFKRLHGKQIPGTGIGLAICQKVVEKYGGRIWVESELEQGACFHFTIAAPEMN